MRLSIFSNVQEPFVFPYFPVGMLTFFLLVSIPYIFFTYQKFTLSSIKCYHLERMEDKCPPLGEVPEPARVPLGSVLESVCGWGSAGTSLVKFL